MIDTSIIYYTDGALQQNIMNLCWDNLIKAAKDKPIITVSQKPIDFEGTASNICVGEIGRSLISLHKQIMLGCEAADTKYVALAEHDILYHSEHFDWIPPTDKKFYYNINHWLVDWETCEYFYSRRKVISMMLANRKLVLRAVRDKIRLLEEGEKVDKDFGKNKKSYRAVAFRTGKPNIDIRHSNNFSRTPKSNNHCYNIFWWGKFDKVKNA